MPKKPEQSAAITSLDVRREIIEKMRAAYPPLFSDEGNLNKAELEALLKDFEVNDVVKFEFRWAGKMGSKKTAFTPSKARLQADPKRSVNFDDTQNVIIEGENLEVLKLLQKSYYNKVKCIYIDPPYNTGHDFVYSDDYSEEKKAYWEQNGTNVDGIRVDTNTESSGRYHSNWLNMMQGRLILAQRLLRDDGVIFVSIDDNEVHNLRKLMDEVFGEEHFVADLVVVSNLKGRSDKRYIATAHERLLMYVKEDDFEESGLRMPEARIDEYDQTDGVGRYRLLGLRKRGGPDTRAERPRMYYPLFVDPETGSVSTSRDSKHKEEVLPMKSDGVDGRWRWGMETTKQRLDWIVGKKVGNEGRYDVFEKDYLETDGEIRRIKPKSVMYSKEYSTDAATKAFRRLMPDAEFDNPKSVPLLKDLIEYSTSKDGGDIVLDFFAGSGTTGHAVMEINQDGGNRRYVMVQLPEKISEDSKSYKSGYRTIADVTMERLRRAGKIIKQEKPAVDTGFKAFVLTNSLIPENLFVPDPKKSDKENIAALELHIAKSKQKLIADYSETDLLYEVMLKDGFDLNFKAERLPDFAKNQVLKVTDASRSALVCLDPALKDETVKALEAHKDSRFICLHRAVDTTKKWGLDKIFGDSLSLI